MADQEDRFSETLKSGYNARVDTKVIQVRARGTLTLPAGIRERYGLSDGDPITLVDLDGTIVLSPKIGLVPKLASEIEKLRKRRGVSLEDLVSGVAKERTRRRKD